MKAPTNGILGLQPAISEAISKMTRQMILSLLACYIFSSAPAWGQNYAFTNFAGLPGSTGSADGTGIVARFNAPNGVALDSAGNVFVADGFNNTIRKITPAGSVTTIAGLAGTSGSNDGTNGAARFNNPAHVAVDLAGNVYVADYYNHTIRKVTADGTVTTLAGLAGSSGSTDGTNSTARFSNPLGIAVDNAGNVYVSDSSSHTIRKVAPVGTNWVVTTLAGSAGLPGSANGTNSSARFSSPDGVAVDSLGNLFVAEQVNDTVREMIPVGTNWIVTTLAGTVGSSGSADGTNSVARFNIPSSVAVDGAGSLYVTDYGNNTIRKVVPIGTNWVVSTLAGSAGSSGSTDGVGSAARFNNPAAVAIDNSGSIYVTDYKNNRITKGTQLILPAAPTIMAATNITLNSFYANWGVVGGATNYLLDVSSGNNFTNCISGYSNLTVGLATTYLVSGLNVGATYYYRVRSQQSGLTSPNSVTIQVTTASAALSAPNGPGSGGNTLTISGAGIGNGADITSVTICGVTAAIQSQTANSVTVLVGAGGSGTGSIKVYSASAGTTTLPAAYTYNPQGVIAGSLLSWSSISNLPVALDTHAAVAVSNKVYVIAGQTYTTTWTPVSTVYVFDTLNPTAGWTTTSNLPANRAFVTGAALSNKIYALGGGSSSSAYVFDTQNPAAGWGSISNLPSTINCAAAATVGGKIYITGGTTGGGTWQSTTWVYDPGQPTLGWLSLSNMPASRRYHTMTELGGKLYVTGGDNSSQVPQANAWVYDPALPALGWLSISNMPTAKSGHEAGTLGGVLFAVSGRADAMSNTPAVFMFDSTCPTQGWQSSATLPIPLANGAGVVVNGSLFAISGGSTGASGLVPNVYKGRLLPGVAPTSGPQAGGTAVTICGSNLGNQDVTGVTLCGVAATLLTDNSPTQLVVSTGAATVPGTGDVVVTSTSFGTTTGANLFTYNVDLAVVAGPLSGGSVSGGGSYSAGSNVQITATVSNSWLFTGWNDGDTNTARTVSVPATNIVFTANFVPLATLSVLPGDAGGGTVTGSGIFIVGSNAQVTATASNGWWFLGWNDGVTNNPRDIVVASNSTYTATFAPVAMVTTWAVPPEGGAMAGDGTYVVGSTATVTATASNNWVFMNWNGSVTNNPWGFTVPAEGQACTANFSTVSTVTVLASPSSGGRITGGGAFLSNSNIMLTVTASNGWMFTGWNDAVTNSTRSIVVPVTNITYTANFSPLAAITVLASTNAGGTVTGSGTFIVGRTVQLTATASNSWGFLGWSDGATNNPRDVVVGASGATYMARFAPTVWLSTLPSPYEAGLATGGGTHYTGSNALLTALASNGWLFIRWNDGNTQTVRTVVTPATNSTYTAQFVYPSVVSVQALPTNGGSVKGGGAYWAGTSVVLTASANAGWIFATWGDGNTQAVRTITVPRSNSTYVANFRYIATLATQASPAGGGTVTGSGVFPANVDAVITAAPQPGWVFLGWSDGVTNTPRTVNLAAGLNRYTANFGSPARVGAAVNQPGLAWNLGGAAGWFDQTVARHDGASAVQSGPIAAGQQTWFQTTTNGPGSLMFWWKVSAAASNSLQFYVNTQLVSQVSGNVDWTQFVTFLSTTNQVTLKWVYTKNSAAVAGSDAGWVDEVTWMPCAYATNVPQLFYQDPTGLLASWVLDGNGGMRFARLLANTGGWTLKAAGDIDGDGVSDLLFQSASGETSGWFMNADGSTRSTRALWSMGGWAIKACGDYEGTGQAQVFFQDAGGNTVYWRLDTNGNHLTSANLGNMGGWKLRGLGDLDGDHKAELFWQNAAGTVAIWYHKPDGSIRGETSFGTGGWALCGVIDIDGDGVSDLLWQDGGGNTGGWFMNSNGTARAASYWWNTGGWKLKAAGR